MTKSDDYTEARAKRQVNELTAQLFTMPGGMVFAANPLLCTVLGLVYKQGATLPQQRVQLYKLAVDTFVFNWEVAKRRLKQGERALDEDGTQAVLEALALHFQRSFRENRAPASRIREIASDLLMRVRETPREEALHQADLLLQLVRDVSGLFIERGSTPGGETEFGFFHLAFQEFLAARAICRM